VPLLTFVTSPAWHKCLLFFPFGWLAKLDHQRPTRYTQFLFLNLELRMKKSKLCLVISLSALAPLSFTSLSVSANSLQDIYELALKNDAQLKADKAGYDAGKAYNGIARAGLLPQINANYNHSNSKSDVTDNFNPPLLNTTGTIDSKSSGWTVSLTQPLFDMSAWYVYKQGQKLSDQAEAQFGADQQSLIVRVAQAYFNVLRSVDTLEATLAEEKALAHQLDQTKQRFEVGLIAITEVHEAQAASDSAVASSLEARGSLSINFEALEVLTGKAEDQIAPLSDKFPVVNPSPSDRAEWVKFALKNNYVLKAAKLQALAAEANADATRAGHYPTVSATLGYSKTEGTKDKNDTLYEDIDTDGSSVSIGVNVPIFSGGRTTYKTRQAVGQELQAQEKFNGVERKAIQDTRALHLSVETDVARVQARKQAILSNQSALDATQSGYEVGTRNLVEVLLAQRNLYQARREYSNALFDYVIDTVKLREVAGMLTPADVQEIDKWLQIGSDVSRSKYEK
jgi:outer membrane protein